MESAKPQKSRMRDHLVSSRDESSKCPNSKKTGRDVSVIDGCYIFRSCPYWRPALIQLKSISYSHAFFAVKYTCIWPLAWCISINRTIHQHLFSDFSPFHSSVKEKGKQGKMKGLTMAQWINLNRNNRSVLALQYFVIWETSWYSNI